MRKAISRSAYYTPRQAAWILGAEPARVARAIRLGALRTVQRRGHLVVPASALTRVLGEHQVDMGQIPAGGAPW